MKVGSLFSGVGAMDLGVEMAVPAAQVVWQAESDPYCRAVLARHWPEVRIYDDVRHIDESAERPDLICGGFPCTDISNAGKRAGIDREQSGLWAEFARILRALRPRLVVVENVGALAARGLDRVLGDLAALGFDAEWACFRASDVGAPHIRERLFVLAYSNGDAVREQPGRAEPERPREGVAGHARTTDVADADGERREAWRPQQDHREQWRPGALHAGDPEHLADADIGRRERERSSGVFDGERTTRGHHADRRGRAHAWPPGPDLIHGWDGPQPAVRRGASRHARWMDRHRLRCLGNLVPPAQVALAIQALAERAQVTL